ncbi:hypothetical protein Q5O24_05230 [Eubacteriaceae bacterium ES3]|nr:hypothetical protein Q5O24_05230 [Eubacteriaceae bacterium ES3]
MLKKTRTIYISIILILCFFTGCTTSAESYQESYLTLISVPIDASIPAVLSLDCILTVTNPDPANPEVNLAPATFAVFGYTNSSGEIEYYSYAKKEAVVNDAWVQVEEGFYRVEMHRDSNNISVTLTTPAVRFNNADPGSGTVTAYEDVLPLDFYTPTEIPGLYSFIDANGNNNFRVYATFETNSNFYPANEDGTMVSGALPVVPEYDALLQSGGINAAALFLATPIACTNVQVNYKV